jgi:hypothetical protein
MPQFVTAILPIHRAAPARPARRVPTDVSLVDALAYRRRMAELRTRAPDTLRARVRRELREAAASSTRSE